MNAEIKIIFEKDFSVISNLVFKVQEAFLVVDYLCIPENEETLHYQKNMNAFIAYSRIIYWEITVIELSKLFSNRNSRGKQREHYNLFNFIKKLKRDGHYSEVKIDQNKICEWESNLESSKHIINQILDLRDKLYAHEDVNNELVEITVTLQNIKQLLDISKDIIKEINLIYYNRGYIFDMINSPVISLKYIIDKLAQSAKNDREQYRTLAKKYDLEDELPK